ncbi:hypothetical protein F0562_029397 [Nyssa sinensis]|uniref:Uncharacterized protein n=1 Tax=Nyssa sinensis TaxID=561372 RepID=A0A5J5B2M3_9ASTE|nr:hypothetical protein F0562_029397 [Nyssa sinensis]
MVIQNDSIQELDHPSRQHLNWKTEPNFAVKSFGCSSASKCRRQELKPWRIVSDDVKKRLVWLSRSLLKESPEGAASRLYRLRAIAFFDYPLRHFSFTMNHNAEKN